MYIAKKKCKLKEREFLIDEHIPDGYVLIEAATRLIRLGVIAEVPEGPLLPSESSIEEPAVEMEELEQEVEAPPEIEEPEVCPEETPVAADDLMSKKRGELVGLAEAVGLKVANNDTKKEIVEAILQVEASGEQEDPEGSEA